MITIQRHKLAQEINEIATKLKELKGIFRESMQPRLTYGDYYTKELLKEKATILCSISAHSRGNIHLKGSTLEKQFELIDGYWQSYELLKEYAA